MEINVYSSDGKIVRHVELPKLFEQTYRDDLIKRAVLSDESIKYQPYGNYKFAGLETSAKYVGRKEAFGSRKNKGIAHLPREVLPKGQFGKVKRVPHSVKGRRAHPPKPEKKIIERINKKEYKKAFLSALSATANKNVVEARYAFLPAALSLPIVVDDSFEKLKKSKDVLKFLEALQLGNMVKRSKRNGSKGALIVADGDILKAAGNIPGIDVVTVESLKVEHLAPGIKAGRLLIISENALTKIQKRLSK